MKNWIQAIENKKLVGFFLYSNGNPFLQGVEGIDIPEDMGNVLKRAKKKGDIELGAEISGIDAAKLLSSLYKKYNDAEHKKKYV